MYRFCRHTKRATATLLALVIAISAVSCLFTGFSAAAFEQSDVTVLNNADGLSQNDSMVSGITTHAQNSPAEGPQVFKAYRPDKLADGIISTSSECEFYGSGMRFFDLAPGYSTSDKIPAAIGKLYADGSERFIQTTLTLKKLTDVNNIVVANHSIPNRRTYHYEIFAAKTAAELYKPENSVYLFTNVDNEQIQNFKIAEGKLTGVKYVGMRIYNPIYTENHMWNNDAFSLGLSNLYPRLYEFNVHGKPSADQSGDILTEAGEMSCPADGSVVKSTELIYFDSEKEETKPASSTLIDGDLSGEFLASSIAWAEDNGGIKYFDDRYLKIEHTLDGLCDVSKIFVYNHKNQKVMTYKYKIYAAENKEDLYKEESLVYDFTNSAFMRGQMFTPNRKAKYVAMVITQPSTTTEHSTDNIYPRLHEFNVYGLRDGEVDPNAVDLKSDNNIAIPEGTSVVKSATVKQFGGTSETENSALTDTLLDGDVATEFTAAAVFAGGTDNNVEYPAGRYVKIQYELQGLCDVNNIYVANHSTPKWMTQEYKLYASKSATDLYSEDNLVYEYSNTEHKQFQLYTLTRKARYVAMVITKPSDATDVPLSDIYVRLREFDVFGTKEEVFENPDGVLTEYDNKTLPTEESVVKSTFVNFVKGSITTPRTGSTTALTDNKLDGEFYGGFTWASGTPGNITYFDNGELRIEHELYGNSDVTDIVVYNHVNPDRMTYKYKIYMAGKREDLYKAESLVYNFVNTNLKSVQVFSVNRKARFVAMVITQPSNGVDFSAESVYPRLHEFNVYGTPDDSIPEGVTDYGDETLPEGNNFLLNMTPGMKITNTEKGISKSISSSTIEELNNGTTGGGGFYTGFTGRDYYADWDDENNKPILRADGSVYVDFEYKLGGTANVERVYIGNHASKDRRIAKYAIYMSKEDKDDLFADGNLVGTYENSGGVRGQEIGFGEIKKGIRRIGVRILDAFYDKTANLGWITKEGVEKGSTSVYLRLNEIAAFGTYEADPFVFRKVLRNGATSLPKGVSLDGLKNLSLPFVPRLSFTKNGVTEKSSIAYVEHLTDGNFATESESYGSRFATFENGAAQYYLNGTYYFDAFYDLKAEAELKYLVVVNTPNVELANAKYNVYLSNSKDDLYSDDNLYTEVDNVKALNNGEGVTVNVICFDEALSGESSKCRYVGIRVFSPACNPGVGAAEVTEKQNNLYIRLRELAVYGEYTDPTFEYVPKNYTDTRDFEGLDKLDEIYGKNILKVKNISYMNNGSKHDIGTNTNTQNDFWKDNSGKVDYDFSTMSATEAGSPVWIFKLPDHELTNIEGFAYQGDVSPSNSAYYISRLKVYVANEREDLLLPQSCVFDYDAEEDGVKMGIIYEFPKDQIPQGSYIAFEFVNPVTSAVEWDYMRMSLLYAWGSEAYVEVNPANIAENMPINAYFNKKGNREVITDSNLTVKEVKNLTDGNFNTFASIETKGKKRDKAELLYNLCGDIKIDKISVKTLVNSNTGFKKMKVYAANTLAEVNEESALIWTYNVGSASGELQPAKTFSTSRQMRYIRFVFEGTKDYLKLFEIEVIGLDNQKMKTRNITSSLSALHLNLSISKNGGKPSFVAAGEKILGQLIDGDATSFIQLIKGRVGEDKYDILLYLDDLRTISSITTTFLKGFREYRPKTINVYVGETEEEATSETAKPLYTINADKVAGDQHTQEIRPMLGRYIRFELSEFYFNEYLVDKDGKGVIAAMLADIKVVGTKVKGLQTDEKNDTLLEFTDAKTGIKATIKRLDINDIFTDVMSIRVTPEKATNWQMRSLQERGSLKVYDKKIYKVELLDLYGNVVKNLDGRKLEISFKKPEDATEGSCIIGDASQRTKIEAKNTAENRLYLTAEVDPQPDADLKVALLGVVATTDPYWDTIGELENFEEGNEDDLKGEGGAEVHDVTWYDSIHTEDGLFTVTPVGFELDQGVKFDAKDISATAPEERYETVLSQSDGKKVAVYYDMELTQNGEKLDLQGQWVEVSMNLAEGITNGFTDLEVFHIDDNGFATRLWCMTEGDNFIFQTDSFSEFVLVGTATDGSTSIGDGSESTDDGLLGYDENDINSPDTGDDVRTLYVALIFLVAAGYVAVRFGKKVNN